MKVLVKDERDVLPTEANGVYFVQKKRTIAQFSYGEKGTFATAADAYKALLKYLAQRRDVHVLRVQLVEFI